MRRWLPLPSPLKNDVVAIFVYQVEIHSPIGVVFEYKYSFGAPVLVEDAFVARRADGLHPEGDREAGGTQVHCWCLGVAPHFSVQIQDFACALCFEHRAPKQTEEELVNS